MSLVTSLHLTLPALHGTQSEAPAQYVPSPTTSSDPSLESDTVESTRSFFQAITKGSSLKWKYPSQRNPKVIRLYRKPRVMRTRHSGAPLAFGLEDLLKSHEDFQVSLTSTWDKRKEQPGWKKELYDSLICTHSVSIHWSKTHDTSKLLRSSCRLTNDEQLVPRQTAVPSHS